MHVCGDDVKDKTTRENAHSRSVEVVSGVRIVWCHAIIDVDFRVMECDASMDAVIGVRVVLCHHAVDNFEISTFLNFPLRVHAVAIHHHFSL